MARPPIQCGNAIDTTLRRRDALYSRLRQTVQFKSLHNSAAFEYIVQAIRDEIGRIPRDAIRSTLQIWPSEDRPLSKLDLWRIAWWFAGSFYDDRVRILQKWGQPPASPEIAGFEVRDHRPADPDKQGGQRVSLQLRVLFGFMSSIDIWQTFSVKYLWVLSRDLGFTFRRRWSGMAGELVMMRFLGLLQADPRSVVRLTKIQVPSYCVTHNKKVRTLRKKPCPRKYLWHCHGCPIGYDECPRGTHRASFPTGICRGSRERGFIKPHNGWFDPHRRSDTCVECQFGVKVNHVSSNCCRSTVSVQSSGSDTNHARDAATDTSVDGHERLGDDCVLPAELGDS